MKEEKIELEEELPGTHTYKYKKDRDSSSSERGETPSEYYNSEADTTSFEDSDPEQKPGIIVNEEVKKEETKNETVYTP